MWISVCGYFVKKLTFYFYLYWLSCKWLYFNIARVFPSVAVINGMPIPDSCLRLMTFSMKMICSRLTAEWLESNVVQSIPEACNNSESH